MTLEEIKARIAGIEKEAEVSAAKLIDDLSAAPVRAELELSAHNFYLLHRHDSPPVAKPPSAAFSVARSGFEATALRVLLRKVLREIEQRDQEIARLEKRLKAERVEGCGEGRGDVVVEESV